MPKCPSCGKTIFVVQTVMLPTIGELKVLVCKDCNTIVGILPSIFQQGKQFYLCNLVIPAMYDVGITFTLP